MKKDDKTLTTQTSFKMDRRFETKFNQHMIETANKAQGLYNDLLTKAQKIHNKEEYDREIDKFVLEVANSAWNHVHKYEDRKLKKRQVQKEEASLFHKLLQDANAGNLDELEEVIDVKKAD